MACGALLASVRVWLPGPVELSVRAEHRGGPRGELEGQSEGQEPGAGRSEGAREAAGSTGGYSRRGLRGGSCGGKALLGWMGNGWILGGSVAVPWNPCCRCMLLVATFGPPVCAWTLWQEARTAAEAKLAAVTTERDQFQKQAAQLRAQLVQAKTRADAEAAKVAELTASATVAAAELANAKQEEAAAKQRLGELDVKVWRGLGTLLV
jgi:hypothetical protein